MVDPNRTKDDSTFCAKCKIHVHGSPDALHKHRMSAHKATYCEFCRADFPSGGLHAALEHCSCRYCNKNFVDNQALEEHLCNIKKLNRNFCTLCGRFCTDLEYHMHIHHPSPSKGDKADANGLPREFFACSEMPHHNVCRLCNKVTSNMKKHMKTHHSGFMSEEQKAQHRHRAGSVPDYSSICKVCGNFFMNMEIHMLQYHPCYSEKKSRKSSKHSTGYTYAFSEDWTEKTYSNAHMEEDDDEYYSGYYSRSKQDCQAEEEPEFKPTPKPLPDPCNVQPQEGALYAILKTSPSATHEEILRAAKQRRVEMHPDRRKCKAGLSQADLDHIDEEAALVGYAADKLCDESLRAKYDADVLLGKQQ